MYRDTEQVMNIIMNSHLFLRIASKIENIMKSACSIISMFVQTDPEWEDDCGTRTGCTGKSAAIFVLIN